MMTSSSNLFDVIFLLSRSVGDPSFMSISLLLLELCRLLSKLFCLQPFFPKDSVSLLFTQFSGSVGWPHGIDTEGKILKFRSAYHWKMLFFFLLSLFLKFRVLWRILKKNSLERYIQLPFMRICKYLKQRVKRIREQNEKSFKDVSKQKSKKTHKEIEFRNNSIQD